MKLYLKSGLIALCLLVITTCYSNAQPGGNLTMSNSNLAIAKAYYAAMAAKNVDGMGKYLASDVYYVNPLAEMTSKEEALTAAKKLFPLIKGAAIHRLFSSENQVVVIFDLEFLPPIGNLPIAALLTIHNKLITKIEMFFDPRPILAKKDEIFSQ